MGDTSAEPLFAVQDLAVEFSTARGRVRAVDGVTFDVRAGEVVGLVGESGSGKSVTAMTALGLISSPPGHVVGGSVRFEGSDLLRLSRRSMRKIRGKRISMIFQDPMTSLNPVHTIGRQLGEALRAHQPRMSRAAVVGRSVELLELVGVPDAPTRLRQFPHEFSGGMRQRAMIAMALAHRPALLIADEPTTALDVTIQAQVLRALDRARREEGAATLLITHDLGVLAELADRIVVMYAGRVVESGGVDDIFHRPKHPYTAALMASVPGSNSREERIRAIPGNPPNLLAMPPGCPFHPRCFLGADRDTCRTDRPMLVDAAGGHAAACHFRSEMPAAAVAAGLMRMTEPQAKGA